MLLQSLILATTTQEATRKIHFALEVTPELFLAGITAITAMISVIIATLTLLQNAKSIEASTRPYIKPYLAMTHIQVPEYFIIIKNFGASSAKITKLTTDIEWEHFTYPELRSPFKYITDTEFPPNHKVFTELAVFPTKKYLAKHVETNQEPLIYTMHIEYISESGKTYVEETKLNLTYDFGHTHGRPSQSSSDYSLKMIANGLVDISEKSL